MGEKPTQPLIEAVNLCASLRDGTALEDVTFSLPAGTVTVLVSAPAKAATLLLDCLSGLVQPDSGTVRAAGVSPCSWSALDRRRVSIVRGRARFPYAVKACELLDQVSLLMEEPGGRERVEKEFELENISGTYLHTLGPEQQQMVRLASSVIGHPDVLLYDRPDRNLSPGKRRILGRMIKRCRGEHKAILFISDHPHMAEGVCNRVLVLKDGRLKALDTPEKLIHSHQKLMRIEVVTDTFVDSERIHALPTVKQVAQQGDTYELVVENHHDSVQQLLEFFSAEHVRLRDLRTQRSTLADAVIELCS